MKVAILGAGPAGMLAALAVERNGYQPVIYSATRLRSELNDDMYLEELPPGILGTDGYTPDQVVEYIREGTARQYAKKLYGDEDAIVSWEDVRWGEHGIWWLQDVYDKLFDRFLGNIVEFEFKDGLDVAAVAAKHNFTMTTLPGKIACVNPDHSFTSRTVWLVRYQSPHYDPIRDRQELVYNGQEGPRWYRYSSLRGWKTWEYSFDPSEVHGEIGDDPVIVKGMKLLNNSCTCNPRVHRVGRWAQWRRGVRNHHPFQQATSILASEGLGRRH